MGDGPSEPYSAWFVEAGTAENLSATVPASGLPLRTSPETVQLSTGRHHATLACNLPRLAELRATLRQRMLASPIMDAPRFARNVETAYRTMWQAWCNKEAPPPGMI